jgi:hypothetical protein
MKTASQPTNSLRSALENPDRGIVGLVDDLLKACRGHNLQLDWQAGRCRVRFLGGNGEELLDVPLRKSVFRAILARVAALCNERSRNSVSPYGGQGELSVGANPPALFRVGFVNTPEAHKLQVMAQTEPAAEG